MPHPRACPRPMLALAAALALCGAPAAAQRAAHASQHASTKAPPLSGAGGAHSPQNWGAGGASSTTAAPRAIDRELREAIAQAPKAAQWPDENFVGLIDDGVLTIKPDGTEVGEYRSTYKLFNERARDLAEVSLPYNNGYQKLEVLRARTIKKDGTVQAVRPEDIREQSPYSEYLMYDDSKAIGFSMPGIEDDCIVDYSWRVTTKPLVPGQFSEAWTFSQTYPVRCSRFTLNVPADKPFKFRVYNHDKLTAKVTTSPDGKTKTYVWERRSIPPMETEPSMPELTDVHCWMEVTSIQSWQEMSKWYAGLVKPQAQPDAGIRETVAKLTAGLKTDDDKARAIYDYVANRVRYVGLEFGISAFKPHAARAVNEKLYGDCKDKATLLVTMLGLAGIKAHPALLYAGSQRPIRGQLPSLESFDHCIAVAEVGGRDVWLDATAETCAYGDIPDGDRGSDALVVGEGAGEFKLIPRYAAKDNCVNSVNHVRLHPDRGADMDIEVTMCGAAAQEWREYARSLTPEKREQMMKQMVPPGGTLKSYDLPDGQKKDGPFVLTLKLEMPRATRKIGELLLVSPINVMSSGSRNPFTKDTRTWPIVNRSAHELRMETVYELPAGYKVDQLPEAQRISGPLFDYAYDVTKSADGRTVRTVVTRAVDSGQVPASDYAKLKGCYDKVLEATDDQMIVLRKAG